MKIRMGKNRELGVRNILVRVNVRKEKKKVFF